MNERVDTLAEEGRVSPDEEKRWNTRTDRMTFTIIRQVMADRSVRAINLPCKQRF